MKLYYITNTLNIDNVLTSEGLSPLSVYAQRMFGYNSFESAPLSGKVDLSNSILLFAQIPYYRVDSSELECAPMIVEISDDALDSIVEDISIDKKGLVYRVKDSRSIILTPANCRMLFTDMRGYKMARLKCQDSKCNKWWEYFKMDLVNMDKHVVLDDLLRNINSQTNSTPNVHDEILANRKKGLLWGYALGYAKSVPSDVAKLRAIQRAIYNNVASVINAGGKASQAFVENIKQLDKHYRELDPIRKTLMESWEGALAELGFSDKQREFLFKTLDMQFPLIDAYAKHAGIATRKPVFTGGPMNYGWSQYQEALWEHTQGIINNSIQSRMIDFKLSDIFLNSDSGLTVYEKTEKEDIFDNIIRKILLDMNNPLTIEQIRIDKANVVIRFNNIYKERIGENYKQTKTYEYMVGLLKCIQDGEPFDPLSNDDALLQNIAAFILKGDSFDELCTYIVEKGISTFEYATAMWCACTGYADTSRSVVFTLSSQDVILSNIYNQVMELVYGYRSNIKLQKQPQIAATGSVKLGNITPIEKLRADNRFLQLPAKTKSKVEQVAQVEELVQDKGAFLMILDSFINRDHEIFRALDNQLHDKYSSKEEFRSAIYEICAPFANKLRNKVRNKPYKYKDAIERAIELEAKIGDPQAFMYILDNTFKPGSKEYETIRDILGVRTDLMDKGNSGRKPSFASQIKGYIGDLFSSQEPKEDKHEETPVKSDSSMLEDFSWVSECEAKILTPAGKEQFRKDAQYVFVEHLSGKSKAEKENADIIKHLYFLLMKMAKESKRDYSLAEIKDIETYLKQKYGIR